MFTTPTALQFLAQERHERLLKEAAEERQALPRQEGGKLISSLSRHLPVRLSLPSRQHPLNP